MARITSVLVLLLLISSAATAAEQPRYNGLLFTADDMHTESMRTYGSKVEDLTPQLDRFAEAAVDGLFSATAARSTAAKTRTCLSDRGAAEPRSGHKKSRRLRCRRPRVCCRCGQVNGGGVFGGRGRGGRGHPLTTAPSFPVRARRPCQDPGEEHHRPRAARQWSANCRPTQRSPDRRPSRQS